MIHGFIQEVYPTYGIILSQNERVFFDCHSLSIGHGEPVYDIRDKVSLINPRASFAQHMICNISQIAVFPIPYLVKY